MRTASVSGIITLITLFATAHGAAFGRRDAGTLIARDDLVVVETISATTTTTAGQQTSVIGATATATHFTTLPLPTINTIPLPPQDTSSSSSSSSSSLLILSSSFSISTSAPPFPVANSTEPQPVPFGHPTSTHTFTPATFSSTTVAPATVQTSLKSSTSVSSEQPIETTATTSKVPPAPPAYPTHQHGPPKPMGKPYPGGPGLSRPECCKKKIRDMTAEEIRDCLHDEVIVLMPDTDEAGSVSVNIIGDLDTYGDCKGKDCIAFQSHLTGGIMDRFKTHTVAHTKTVTTYAAAGAVCPTDGMDRDKPPHHPPHTWTQHGAQPATADPMKTHTKNDGQQTQTAQPTDGPVPCTDFPEGEMGHRPMGPGPVCQGPHTTSAVDKAAFPTTAPITDLSTSGPAEWRSRDQPMTIGVTDGGIDKNHPHTHKTLGSWWTETSKTHMHTATYTRKHGATKTTDTVAHTTMDSGMDTAKPSHTGPIKYGGL